MKKYLYIAISLITSTVIAQNIPQKLFEDRAVQDYVGLLNQSQQMALNTKLTQYADSTSTGIVIAIINDVEDDINFQAAQMLSAWGIGQKGKDNGVLLLMAVNQRRIAISTGYGVEGLLTDALSRRIIEQDILPHFRNQDYYSGFEQGTSAIIKVLSGAYKNEASDNLKGGDKFAFFIFIGCIALMIFLMIKKGGKHNGKDKFGGGGFDLGDFIILSGLGRRSSSGGGFGGFGSGGGLGGFGGFGGGMGGGGGASGSW